MDAGSAKGETTVQEPTRAQRTVARRTAEARATVPDVELVAEVEMARCLALGDEIGCSVTAMLVRASALALVEVPRANGAYRDAKFELYSRVNVGVAIDTEDSYVVPTVFDADGKPLGELAEELRLLTHRARDGALTPPELSGATFTVWNLGTYGVASATAVITPPQAAAIAAGAVRAGPVVRDGAIVPGETMTVTLACDHRILYGAQAARFLVRIKEMLEEATL